MTTETHTVAMTDPQLTNNNNNNDGEPKYLHKKFKKVASTEVATKVETKVETKKEPPAEVAPSENPKKKLVKEVAAKVEGNQEPESEPAESKKNGYVCSYCKLSWAKPSVLEKHIRSHTNERPFPCIVCGFAFKTRSNLYKHRRSRAHALKMKGRFASKVSEDSDISLSDSASNGAKTPPPPPSSTPSSTASTKTVKTGKIYKPKFHTALHNATNETETSSLSSNSSSSSYSSSNLAATPSSVKPNAEQLQEHIDKIITDNQAIVDAVDPRLHKLMQRQQSLIETKLIEQPLNLSSGDEASVRKRCYSESFTQDNERPLSSDGSIIKDLLSKTDRTTNKEENLEVDNFICPFCKISYTSADTLEAHKRYYCKGVMSPRRPDFQLDLDKRDSDFDIKTDYYSLQPLQSPGPLLGNTRLVDAYVPPVKKQRTESVPTTLRSLEELSKYPRPNSLQMFGGEVRILDNTGETKTMRIEPRQTNSPTTEHIVGSKCATSETSSIVVRSGLHSGGTMVHKPPCGSTPTSTPGSSISLPDAPKLLAPIVPNISTTNLAPAMTCYNYLEPHLNPLTNITAYNPLTLPQAGIASILHGGKVIPYVPGMPGPHTLTNSPSVDISPPSVPTGDATYKVIPGLPGLHMISQPLDLASPVRIHTPAVPGIPGPLDSTLNQPLDLASPAREIKATNFKTPSSESLRLSLASPKVSSAKVDISSERYTNGKSPSVIVNELSKLEVDRLVKTSVSVNSLDGESHWEGSYEASLKPDKVSNYPARIESGVKSPNSYNKMRCSPKPNAESRKRPSTWSIEEFEERTAADRSSIKLTRQSPALMLDSITAHENARLKANTINGAKVNPEIISPVILVNLDSSKTEVPNKTSIDVVVKSDFISESKSPWNGEDKKEETSNPKFLRPTSLPLKPGTFTPKKHHGITPTANTLPLISPETPRQRKSYGQVFFNGHAYTYLGLKCSTRLYYCTLNRPQPMYVMQQNGLSMYSNWKICKESPPDVEMAHYDSRHRPLNYTIASMKQDDIMTHSSQRPTTPASPDSELESDTQEKTKRIKIFDGGFESNEDYTYVRGRGRGRYVCEECGIRCKKPSMLKKHIRTHTDVRPYTCKHCTFSFKTKGNLTKHMKSKAHYKKCVEMGIVPVPTSVCDENIDKEAIARLAAGGGNTEESSSEEDETEGDDSSESGSEEHEAAQSLLNLSQHSSSRLPGLLPSGRPRTYPYTLSLPSTSVTTSLVSTSANSSPLTSQGTSVIHNELSHRYYFPSNRTVSEESRSSVIQSSIKDESDVELEEFTDASTRNSSQPMDLTTKQIPQCVTPSLQKGKHADILTPVSEPILLQTIVQSMERLPIQGREWKPETDGHMLQAYLTERHVMDSKIKEQYRVGSCKVDKLTKERELYFKQKDSMVSSLTAEPYGVPTVTYTDPTKVQPTVLESRIKNMSKQASEDIKMEIREKIYQNNGNIERRPFDIGSIHKEKDLTSRSLLSRDCFESRLINSVARNAVDYSMIMTPSLSERTNFALDLPTGNKSSIDPEKSFIQDVNNRISSHVKNEMDRSSIFNAMKMMKDVERPREGLNTTQPSLDIRVTPELKVHRSHTPDLRPPSRDIRTPDLRPPSREIRTTNQDYRLSNQEFNSICHDLRTKQEFPPVSGMEMLNAETRPPSRDARMMTEYRSQDPILQSPLHDSASLQEVPRTKGMEIRASERLDSKHGVDINKQSISESIKHSVARKMVVGGSAFKLPSSTGGNSKPQAEFLQPSSGTTPNYVSVMEDGRSVCGMCNKVFSKDAKESHLRLHINIHFFERPFRCESCAIPFRTKGHLTKHERSISHRNKVSMTSTFGAATTSNPRPFKCTDCKVAFRIHGHLAKHLRSKMHIMKLECLCKLPFGTYAEMERSGVNLNDIDTTDCENSLTSLQMLAQKLYEKDPSKMNEWNVESIPSQGVIRGENSSDEGEPISSHSIHQYPSQIVSDPEVSRAYHVPLHEESKLMAYKCPICSASMLSLNELQVHSFVEHNIETDSREKEGKQKRFIEECPIRQEEDVKKLDDT